MFILEKDVPVGGVRMSWPFKTMAQGDSFVIPADDVLIQKARLAAGVYQNKHKARHVRFSIRKQPDGTARCWRID